MGGGNRKEDMDRNQRKRLLSVDEDIDTGLEDVDAAMPRSFDSTDHFLCEKRKFGCFQSLKWNLAKYVAEDNTNHEIVKR